MAVPAWMGKGWTRGGLLLACALALIGVVVLRPWERPVTRVVGPSHTITVTMKGMLFDTNRIDVTAGEPVTIVLMVVPSEVGLNSVGRG